MTARTSGTVGAIAAAGLITGLAFQWYLFVGVGVGADTDAFLASVAIPQVVTGVVAGALTQVLSPLLAPLVPREQDEGAWTLAWTLLVSIGVMAFAIAVSAPLWMPLLVPGFDGPTTASAIRMVRIHAVTLPVSVVSTVFLAIRHARGEFVRGELGGLAGTLASLVLLWMLLEEVGIEAAAWAVVTRAVVELGWNAGAAGAVRRPRWRSPVLAEALGRARPLLLAGTYFKSDRIVDRVLTSAAPVGSLSLYHLAQTLFSAGHVVFHRSIVAPLLPDLARRAAAGDWPELRRRAGAVLWVATIGAIGCAAVLFAVGEPLLQLALRHGRFGRTDVRELWLLMVALSGFWIGGVAGQVLGTPFYATGRTGVPARVGAIGFTVGSVLKVLGFWTFGILGIAGAAGIHQILNAILLWIGLRGLPSAARSPGGQEHTATGRRG